MQQVLSLCQWTRLTSSSIILLSSSSSTININIHGIYVNLLFKFRDPTTIEPLFRRARLANDTTLYSPQDLEPDSDSGRFGHIKGTKVGQIWPSRCALFLSFKHLYAKSYMYAGVLCLMLVFMSRERQVFLVDHRRGHPRLSCLAVISMMLIAERLCTFCFLHSANALLISR